MEFRRIILSRNLIICAVVLIALCCGFYVKEQGDNSWFGTKQYYDFKSETVNMYKACTVPQARESINSRLDILNVFSQLDMYSSFKADMPMEYKEYYADEEKEYRQKNAFFADIYDSNPAKYSYQKYSMIFTALTEVKNQVDYVDTYDEFLENIKKQAQNMSTVSIFSKENSFSLKNIEKTLKDYDGLEGIKLKLGIDEPVTSVMNYSLVHFLMLVFIILLVSRLMSERKQGLWSMVYAAPKGRAVLALRRLGIISAGISIMGVLLYGSLFATAFWYYGGLEDIYRNIQSIEMFRNFIIAMPVWAFILLYIAVNIVCSILVALVVWIILSLISNTVPAFATLGIIGAAEYVMYKFIPIQSNFSILKCVNLFAFIDPTETLITYRNLNLFSLAINRRRLCTIVLVVLLVVFSIVCVRINARKKPVQSLGRFEIFILKLVDRLVSLYRRIIERLSPVGHELYKILILQKGILVLVVLAWYLISTINTSTIYYSRAGTYINEFYEKYSGRPGVAVNRYLEKLENEINDVYEEYAKLNEGYEKGEVTYDELFDASMKLNAYSAKEEACSAIRSKTYYLQMLEMERGIKGWLLNDAGYKCLFDEDSRNVNNTHALLALFAVVLMLSGVFSYEKKSGTVCLTRSAYGGRKLIFKKKLAAAAIITFIIWLIVYGIEIYNVARMFGLDCFGAPVQSLEFMYSFPFKINIGMYMFMVYFIRLLELLALGGIIMAVSAVLDYEVSIMASAAALVIPGVLYVAGITAFRYISVIDPLGLVNLISSSGAGLWWLVPVIFILLLGIAGYIYAAFRWCVTGRIRNA
ncbi:MAG: hypothetical protein IJM37_03350 [Lachnospiraceae bacterium]|nr:hypothetical protein [Lachnospiraceae bacterium]